MKTNIETKLGLLFEQRVKNLIIRQHVNVNFIVNY